jgi:hypothetical protein
MKKRKMKGDEAVNFPLDLLDLLDLPLALASGERLQRLYRL